MINIVLRGHDFRYELSEFLKLFSSEFSFLDSSEDFGVIEDNRDSIDTMIENIGKNNNISIDNNDILILSFLEENEDDDIVVLKSNTSIIKNKKLVYEKNIKENIYKHNDGYRNEVKSISKRIVQRSMFDYLLNEFDSNVPWGILTGIRPVKIIHSLLDKGKTIEEIREYMKYQYSITDEKLDLIIDVALRERVYIYPLSDEKISLYISIPFCPTRCLYCSFPSHPLARFSDLREPYVEALLKEARGVNELIKRQGNRIESLYIGGGTPTALEAHSLEKIITEIFKIFDLSNIVEFTVEAGRPDSITEDKLKVLKANKVTRISINPQTMNNSTLKAIGRNHTVEEIVECFHMARKLGFDNINMDLILGLPGETPEMVSHTMDEIIKLNPESVTVHTLALKRASDLKMNIDTYKEELTSYEKMIEMIAISKSKLLENEYLPYYLYRQKHMLGNLENIGYSKKGYECVYNMQIMEERQSNYAIGAGAVSKFVYLDENRIERVDDVKNVEVYLQRVDDMIEKKVREVEKNDNKCTKRD